MKNTKLRIRDEKGFTLVEMIIVIAIIGLLVAIIIPQAGNALDNSRIKAALASGKSIQAGMEMYYSDPAHNAYPATLASYTDLQTALGGYINLPATEAAAPFTFVSYNLNTTTGKYTLVISARDRAKTQITVTAESVQ